MFVIVYILPDEKRLKNNEIGLHNQVHVRWRFRVFWICTKNDFVLLLFCTIRNKVQYDNKTYREIWRMYIIFTVIIDIITRCFDVTLTWKIAYSTQALWYTVFWKLYDHVVFKTGIYNSNNDFQHYHYFENKSYNWKRCEFQNERFKTFKQNILELRLDVTLSKISKQRLKIYKPHKVYKIFQKNPLNIAFISMMGLKFFSTYYWFSQLAVWTVFGVFVLS